MSLMDDSFGDRKRGSDHFSNMDSNFDQKRVKHEDILRSKVLHIRNLPEFASEADVITLGIPFGKVVNILKIPTSKGRGRPQAFLEMEDEIKAEAMVNYYEFAPARIKGSNVYVQYSSHKELKIEKQSPTVANLLAAAALASSGDLASSLGGDSLSNFGNFQNNGGGGLLPNPTTQTGSPVAPATEPLSNVLRVVVDNMLYPVSIDALHLIFSKYGMVIKIVICTKTNQFQVFVQYADSVPAGAAKSALDGQNIYNGCCTMKIGYSRFTNLNVKYNNDKTRDFSRPDLPSGEGQPSFDPNLGLSALGAVLSNPFLAASAAAATVPNLGLLGAGNMLPGIGPGNPGLQAPIDERHGRDRDYDDRGRKSVLLVSELCTERIKCDDLFTLFGAYGDVMRVKILYNKPDTALIQFADSQHAQTARENLHEVRFQGKRMRVSTSKHDNISMPKKDAEGAHLTKDYTRSNSHRFKQYGSKNYQNIFPPSRTLHLSNIPGSVTEEDIRSLFSSKTDGRLTNFEFFTKEIARGKKMALVEMSTVEEAVQALVDLHDYPIGDDSHLRVSFTRKTIR